MNKKYHPYALLGAVVSLISIFLPFAALSEGEGTVSLVKLSSMLAGVADKSALSVIVYLAAIFSALSGVSIFVKKKQMLYVWQGIEALSAVFWTLLFFSTKTIVESAGLASGFLNNILSFGYYLGVIAAFFALVMVMKTTKTNTGYIVLTILDMALPDFVDSAYRSEGRAGLLCGILLPQEADF